MTRQGKSALRFISFVLLFFAFSLARGTAAVTLTCNLPAGAQVNVAYAGSCTASGGTTPYVYSISVGALPGGLSLNTTSGAITGTPNAAGSTSFTVKATDSAATPGTATQAISNFVVAPVTLTLACSLPAGAREGVAYSGSCTASGGTTAYTYSISVGALPGGLTLNTSTGAITGTPNTAGTTSFTVKVTDSGAPAQTATRAIANFAVAPAILTLTCNLPAGAQVGVAYSGSCTGTGGTTPYVFSISVGALPGGLSLNTSTGAITGVPITAGTTSFTVKATDSEATPQTATQAISNFTVAPAVLTLTCNLPAGAQVGVAYSGSCAGAGGTTAYTYSISVGALPGGLTLNTSTGAIAGTPNTAGTTSFTVRVTDSGAPVQTATRAIANFAVAPPVLTVTCNLPAGAQVGVAYSGSCTGAGGTTPYTYSISVGVLPGGLSLNTSTGAITGTPNTSGTTSFTVRATDSGTPVQAATQAISNFTVAPPTLTLACNLPAGAQVGVGYSGTCTASGGTTPYAYSISVGALSGGLNLNASTGAITGTPNTAGATSFTVSVADSGSPTQSASLAITNFVVAPTTLTLSCTASNQGVVGTPYSGSCSAAGGTSPYTYSVSAGTLPGGLTVNPASGAITGTPNTAGVFTFTMKAADSGSQTATQSLTITIIPALNITTTALGNGIVGIAYSASCSATGGTAPYTFSISAGSLPNGLSLNPANCAITGTPGTSGTFNFSIKVIDSGTPQQTDTQALAIIINPALAITSGTPPNGVVGLAYTFSLTAQNGAPPYSWSIASGSLPAGLTLNGGVVSGTPNAAGTSPFTVKVADSGGQIATQSSAITIIPALNITTTTIANGIVGIGYSASCSATGGVTPYTFSTSAGSLPSGLALNPATCAITGTPSASGTFNFSISVTDSGAPQQMNTQPLSITIGPALVITSTTAPNGSVGLAYVFTLTAQNGGTPYSWAIVSGALPSGLGLNTATGAISGTPNAIGSYSFTARVTDSGSPAQSATHAFTVSIAAGLTITTTSVPNGIVGNAYSATLNAQNGVTPYTWTVSGGSLPAGLSPSAAGVISGTPSAAGTFPFTVRVTDSSSPTPQAATQLLSITIASVLNFPAPSLPRGIQGLPYPSASCSASGGTPPYSFVTIGALPAGLAMNPSTCAITGMPTAAVGTAFTIKVTDSGIPGPQSASQPASIAIGPAFGITTSTVPNGLTGQPYSVTLTTQNGTPSIWVIAPGALPNGLTLGSTTGVISGTPTAVGTYSFTVKVTDSGSPAQTATHSFSNVLVSAGLTITTSGLGTATVAVPYSATLTAQNGTPPYTWALSAGSSLPDGLTPPDPSTGTISGTPKTPGTTTFSITVTDNGTPVQSTTEQFTIVVNPAIVCARPVFSFSGVPSSQIPAQTVSGVTFAADTVSCAAWPIIISLGFAANAVGVPIGYADPALQFIDSSGTKLGTTYPTLVPALTTTPMTVPSIAPGTVAGNISLTLSVQAQTGAISAITVPPLAPIISPGSVQILNVTASGFDVELVANSSPRDLKTATFAFGAAPGTQINGTSSFTVDVSPQMADWYVGSKSAMSQSYGSAFSLTVPFTFSGSSAAISSVTVTLTNSVGTSSAVAGTK